MTKPGSLVLRADASAEIGTGHVMRCLALAQAWQDAGGKAVFVCAQLPPPLAGRLKREGCTVVRLSAARGSPADADATLRVARAQDAAWTVVDGYAFASSYYRLLRGADLRVLAIDDMAHLESYPADVLLNQNLSATPRLYAGKVDDRTHLLLGPRCSLLRREFRQTPACLDRPAGSPLRVLISFGGGDAENFTGRILQKMADADSRKWEVVVLAGAANPHVAACRRFAVRAPFACEVRVNEENVARLMAWAAVAITAAGSTVWELAAMRLPALIGAHEENQLAGLEALRAVPFFRVGTVAELLQRDLAAELRTLAATAVPATAFDALGAERVVACLRLHRSSLLLSA
jgi:UDP-2,4-diacetamido-2,4,6-trideoxy-beta-L-altropyranose hydrolase